MGLGIFVHFQILERQRLSRRIRARRNRESAVRNGGKLRGMGQRFRTFGRGGRCPGRRPRIQSDPIQHEAWHILVCLALHFQQRSEGCLGPSQGTVLHNPDQQGHVGPDLRGHLSEGSFGRAQHGGDAGNGRSLAPFECTSPFGSQTPPSPLSLNYWFGSQAANPGIRC